MNEVIIIGNDHVNTLNTARVFGINGINPYGIIISKHPEESCCVKCKYWTCVKFIDDAESLLDTLLSIKVKSKGKPVLVPTCDVAMFLIDSNADSLFTKFILPGFKNKPGKVVELMNKHSQAEWAKDNNIPIASTYVVDLFSTIDYSIYPYPCILKPVVSAEGSKSDIRKCENAKELQIMISEFKSKGYKRILLQEFIIKDYECELWGAILEHDNRTPYLFTKHLREWPLTGGTVTCHQFISDPNLVKQAENILQIIKSTGYRGNIDIELFCVDGRIILNEINWRNSGDVYAIFYPKVHYPYYSYLDMNNNPILKGEFTYKGTTYAINERNDFCHVFYAGLSIWKWLKYFILSKDYAFWFLKDPKPAFYVYKRFLLKTILKIK